MLKLEKIYAGHRCRTVIENINIELKPCEKLIVSGAAKSGKTTLLQTAAGVIPPVSGCVFFDYLPITEYSRRELSRRLCYIPQDILPRDKINKLVTALKAGCEYILIDEPFAFLSEKEKTELLFFMQSRFKCSFIITQTSQLPVNLYGFKELYLSSQRNPACFM